MSSNSIFSYTIRIYIHPLYDDDHIKTGSLVLSLVMGAVYSPFRVAYLQFGFYYDLLEKDHKIAKSKSVFIQDMVIIKNFVDNENNQILLKNLDGLGADKAVEPQTFGKILFQKIEDFNNKQKEIISNLYKQIKDDGGLSAKYDSKLFIDKTKVALTRHERFLPTEFKGILMDSIQLNVI